MNLPAAIQRQVEEAEALERELYAQPEGTVQEEPSQEPEAQVTEPVVEATEHVEPEPQNVEPVEQRREDDSAYWKQRFNTVQGILNSQSAQFTEQLRQANDRIQALANELEQQRSAQRSDPAQADDKDAETFGEDLVATMDRRAEQKAAKLVAEQLGPLQKYVQQLEAKLGVVDQQVAVSSQDRFLNELARQVPDYEAVNADDGFLNWLGEVDPVYGVPRQVALDAASNALDASRTAAVFNAYKSLTSKQVQTANKQQVRQELERQTAPSTVRGSAQPSPAGKVYTADEYTAALDPRNIAKMGRAAAEALAADAEAAYYEGRVRF